MEGKGLLTPGPEKPPSFIVNAQGGRSGAIGDRLCRSVTSRATGPIPSSSAGPLKALWTRKWLIRDQTGAADLKPQPISPGPLYIRSCELHQNRVPDASTYLRVVPKDTGGSNTPHLPAVSRDHPEVAEDQASEDQAGVYPKEKK